MILFTLSGLIVLAGVVVDMYATTIAPGIAGGFFTRRLGDGLWALLRKIVGGHHRALQLGGLCIVATVVLAWIVAAYIGWCLVLIGLGSGVVHGSTGQAASVAEIIYYTGVTIATLGNGQFVPDSGLVQTATVAAALNGFLIATLSLTFLSQMLAGVTATRQLASSISDLADSPSGLAKVLWPGSHDTAVDHMLLIMAEDIREVDQLYYSYPVLHYFHSAKSTAIGPAIARLSEALTIRHAIDDPPHPAVLAVVTALDRFASSLSDGFISPESDAPPLPTAAHLEDITPGLSDRHTDIVDVFNESQDHRRRLYGVITHDGWTWDDVLSDDEEPNSGLHRDLDQGA